MDDLISRREAIDALGERPMVWTDDDQYALGERNQYDMNRLAIETLPSAQPKIEERKEESAQNVPKEDLISRKAAIEALWEIRQEEISDGRRFHDHCSLSTAVDVIKDLPSAQPDGWLEQNKDKILQAGMEGREIDFRIGGRLFAIREKAQ